MKKIYILVTILGLSINISNLTASEDINAANIALIRAAQLGSQGDVALLLQAGADVNATDNNGVTALMRAAGSGSQEVVALLLQAGAVVNATDYTGWTALMYAACSGYQEVVALLLQAGANINATDNRGATALMYAVWAGFQNVVALLLKAGADANATNNNGWTAVDYVIRNPEIERLLMRYKAFKFVDIDQEFNNEPKPEDYILDKEVVAGTVGDATFSMLKDHDEEYGQQIEEFTKAHVAYWHNKVQRAYEPFSIQNDVAPLRTLITQEIYTKPGLLSEIASFFNSREDFLYVLNELKAGATAQELERLQKIINADEMIAQKIAEQKKAAQEKVAQEIAEQEIAVPNN